MDSLLGKKNVTSMTLAWIMLLWLLVAQIMVSFVGRSLAPLSILIGTDLSPTHTQIGMLPAALFLGQSLVVIPSGMLVDRIGSKKQLLGTTLFLGVSIGIIVFTSQFYLLLLAVILGGGAYASMHPITNRGILYWFPQRKRGMAMGIKQMGITVGAALAALVLLPFAKEIGWRPVIIISCIVLVLVGFLVSFYYSDPEITEKKAAIDKKLSIITQLKKILENKPLLLVSISAMGLQGAQLCLTTYIVIFAYERLALSLVIAGLLLGIAEIGGSVGRVAWGTISDLLFKGERMKIMMIVTILTAICAFIFSILTVETPLLFIIIITSVD